MEFSQDEVIRRTAKRMGVSIPQVERFLEAYGDEFIQHARETDVTLLRGPMVAPTETVEPPAAKPVKSPAKRTAKPAARKAAPPVEQPVTKAGAEAEAVGNPT